ncbi:MAG: glycosyltransferase family A protein [bacterium]
MILLTVSLIGLAFASFPCGLFLANLFYYRRLPKVPQRTPESPSESSTQVGTSGISILIPARNEARNIAAALESVLSNKDCIFEIIVLDDHSTDETAQIVTEIARTDQRVSLKFAPELPEGWCGKQHACYTLSKLARYPLLLFIDADVKLTEDAISRITFFANTSAFALASGVPRQELGTFSERLLIPLIHFILLGFLPLSLMRRTNVSPADSVTLSAGCGQLFIARKVEYELSGGHRMIRDSLHDGLKLPRVFRKAGFKTDLFDATDIASCRMYRNNIDTWQGLGKNAIEGIAAPGVIVPMTFTLLLGQIMPFVMLSVSHDTLTTPTLISMIAVCCVYIPRLIGVARFNQVIGSALLHPLGVLGLLVIQWNSLIRFLRHKPSQWKGRSYP